MQDKVSWHLRNKLGEVQAAVASTRSLRAAARQLGVSPSSVSRLVQSGKVTKPAVRPRPVAELPSSSNESFEVWARHTFDLTRAEDQLVSLAQQALDLARTGETPAIQLAAMKEFRALLKDLSLPAEGGAYGHNQTTRGGLSRPA